MEAALWGLLGTIAGAGASICTTLITSRNAAGLQLSAAKLETLERHRSFQRDTLVELQDALHDEMRATSLVYQADELVYRQSGIWGKQLLGDELNQKAHLAGRRTLLLTERVADSELREHVKAVRSLCTGVLMAPDKLAADAAWAQAASDGASAMEHIGQDLRSLYSGA